MPGTSTTGSDKPSVAGRGYGNKVLKASDPEIVGPLSDKTGNIAIKADSNNDDIVYIGWDENVTIGNGFPLDKGQSMSMHIDTSEQAVWAIAASGGDSVRWIASD